MGTVVFNDKGDISIFFVLTVMLFTEFYTGYIQTTYTKNKSWYQTISSRIFLMPPPWLFPLAWMVLYVCIFISMFLYYRSDETTYLGYNADVVTILFVFNIMANKMWAYLFFSLRQTIVTIFVTLFLISSASVIMALMFVIKSYPSAALYIPYVVWCIFALYLNIAWVYYEYRTIKPMKLVTYQPTKHQYV